MSVLRLVHGAGRQWKNGVEPSGVLMTVPSAELNMAVGTICRDGPSCNVRGNFWFLRTRLLLLFYLGFQIGDRRGRQGEIRRLSSAISRKGNNKGGVRKDVAFFAFDADFRRLAYTS